MFPLDKHVLTSKIYYINYIGDYKTCRNTEINYDNYIFFTQKTV